MSRTFRRKKSTPEIWTTHDYRCISRGVSSCGQYRTSDWVYFPYEGKELNKQIAKWHTSDNHSGIHSVPSWFNNLYFQRPKRRKETVQLRKMLVSQDYDDYSFDLHKKDSGWDWW